MEGREVSTIADEFKTDLHEPPTIDTIAHRENGWLTDLDGMQIKQMARAIEIVQQRGVVGLIHVMCERCREGDIPSECDGDHNRWHRVPDDPDDLSACCADALWSLVNHE